MLANRFETMPACQSKLLEPVKTLIRSTVLYRALKGPKLEQQFGCLTETDRAWVKFFSAFIREGDLIFDVGAHRGSRSKVFLRLKARVVAFEPQRECVAYLRIVLGRNKAFALVEKALGPVSNRTAVMSKAKGMTVSSLSEAWMKATIASGRFPASQWERRQRVNPSVS